MKHCHIWAAAAAMMLIGSCTAEVQPQKQEVEPQTPQETSQDGPQVEKRELVITAYSSDNSSTKSSRGSDGTFYWSKGDKISVFYGSGTQGGACFTSTITEEDRAEVSDFQGEIQIPEGESHEYWGIYPYNPLNEWNETTQTLTTEIPSRQTAAAGTFADGQFISIGHSDELSMGFYHLCGGIKVKVSTSNVTMIYLKGNNGEALAGVVEVMFDQQNHPYVSRVVNPQYEIVLTPPASAQYFTPGVEYFFVTKPVEFRNGFTFTFETDNTVGTRVINSSMTINRARFQWSNSAIDTGVSFVDNPDIVKPNVRAYMDGVDYSHNSGDPDTRGGYSYTAFRENPYTPTCSYTSYDDQPKPVTISWSGRASKIVVSTSPSFDDEGKLEITISNNNTTSTNVYNLIPGVVYYYRVTNGNNVVQNSGSFVPKGSLRQIYIAGTNSNYGIARNFRDMGGWKAGDKTIRYGKLYRGAKISKSDVTTTARAIFQNSGIGNLGIGLDMELRGGKSSDNSVESYYQDRPFPNIEWAQFSVIKFFDIKRDFANENVGYTSKLYRQAIKKIITFLQNDGRAIYYHCEGGADRTGTLAFLIEALLGVSESDISKDYELTTFRTTFYSSGNIQSDYERFRHIEYTSNLSENLKKYPFREFIRYIWQNFDGNTLQEKVTNWALGNGKDGLYNDDPLTLTDIAQLKSLLLE